MNPVRGIDSFVRRRPVLVDVLVTVVLWLNFGLGILVVFAPGNAIGGPQGEFASHWITVLVLSTGLIVPWAFRRTRPVLSAGIIALFCFALLFFGPDFLPALITVPMTVHNLAVRAPRWASLAGLGTGLFGAVANGVKVLVAPMLFGDPTGAAGSGVQVANGVSMAVFCGLLVLTAWAFGDLSRTRRLTLEALEDRASRLEREAAQERALAAADERSHIAREMHDIVAHSLQVIISQADGGQYAAAHRPELAAQTLETIGQTGRTALADMRQLLGVLRAQPAEGEDGTLLYRPQPGLADVDVLVETMRVAGLDVDLHWEGAPRRDLPAGGELAAYRVVQEALTNTLRHGGPDAHAQARLAWGPAGLDLEVLDDGRGAAADPGTRGSGQGLHGMGERVRLFEGTVESGPRPSGGFRVAAHLPYRPV